jgi:hypothetical protein
MSLDPQDRSTQQLRSLASVNSKRGGYLPLFSERKKRWKIAASYTIFARQWFITILLLILNHNNPFSKKIKNHNTLMNQFKKLHKRVLSLQINLNQTEKEVDSQDRSKIQILWYII